MSERKSGLPPLEYSDCFLDSPSFRETITLYELELESNTRVVKNLVKECDNMIQKTEEFSRVQQAFGHALGQFHFKTIGTEQTEDEERITQSLQSFSRLLLSIEDYRHYMLNAIRVRLLKTLEQFRKEHMKKTIEEKKRFDDASKKYYGFLDNYLSTKPSKRKDTNPVVGDLPETDQFEREKAQFRQISFDYVCRLQDVHAQKHFELVEPIIGYVTDVSTFLHQAYEETCSLRPQIEGAQFQVQLLRETHDNEQEKAYQLKAQVIEEGQNGLVHHPEFVKQGLVFIMDKKKMGGIAGYHWQKYFCQFKKSGKRKLVKFQCNQKSSAEYKTLQLLDHPYIAISSSDLKCVQQCRHDVKAPIDDWMDVVDCVRSKAEEVDRRFCFDLTCKLKGTDYKLVIQGVGQEDRTTWLQVLEGREPVYSSMKALDAGRITPVGFKFVEKCIKTIEERGLDEEGLYRRPGVLARANKLLKEITDSNAVEKMDFSDEIEWDTKTLASVIKGYFAKHLGEPVMTFQLHQKFIDSAKISEAEKREQEIFNLIRQLPEPNHELLALLISHLRKVADMCSKNLMKPSNLGVCFGPTLMRPERETVASIVDIRYQNIIVEFLIQHEPEIFSCANEDKSVPVKHPKPDLNRSSNSESSFIKRRPPPAAPKPVEDMKYNEQGAQSMIGLTSSNAVSPPLMQRQSVAVLASSYNSGNRERSAEVSGAFDHLEPLAVKKPASIQRRSERLARPHPPPTVLKKRSESSQEMQSAHTSPPELTDCVPSFLSRRSPPSPPVKSPAPDTLGGRRAKALYDCDAEDEVELSFHEEEILYNVLESEEPDWLLASNAEGKRGLIPANYIQWIN